MNTQLAASCLGLVLTGADWAMCWNDEKRIIWRSPFRITAANFLYIATNYLSFVIHATDVGFASFGRIKYPHGGVVPHGICLAQFTFKMIFACTLGTLLHLILMLRVYALYARKRFMTVFLVLSFVGRKAAIIRMASPFDKFSEYRDPFLDTCVPAIRDDLHIHILIYVLMELGLHAIWCGLTLLKTWNLRDVRTSCPTQNLSPVLNRDALLVYVAIVGVFISILVGTFKAKATDIITFCAFPALVSVTSRSGCRVIIHLQRLSGTEDPEKDSGDLVIFSTIDLTGDTCTRSA